MFALFRYLFLIHVKGMGSPVEALYGDRQIMAVVVIDEVAGMLIACVALPHTPAHLGAVFLSFRSWDIVKCLPMKQLERLPDGWSIMADDIAAGLLARLCLLPWG